MEQLSLSKWLKAIAIGIGICGLIVYLLISPALGYNLFRDNIDMSNWYWPWLIFVTIIAIPCYMSLFEFWKICCEVGRDNSFSRENAKSLKRISQLVIIGCIILIIGNVVLFFLNINHPGIAIIMLIILFVGIAIAVFAATLSHLILNACKLKEENELTI